MFPRNKVEQAIIPEAATTPKAVANINLLSLTTFMLG